jgi:hypothetical protein
MFNALIGSLTALMVMGNVTGIHTTAWWGIAGMYFGCALLRNFLLISIEKAREKRLSQDMSSEEVEEVISELKKAVDELEETKETGDAKDKNRLH